MSNKYTETEDFLMWSLHVARDIKRNHKKADALVWRVLPEALS